MHILSRDKLILHKRLKSFAAKNKLINFLVIFILYLGRFWTFYNCTIIEGGVISSRAEGLSVRCFRGIFWITVSHTCFGINSWQDSCKNSWVAFWSLRREDPQRGWGRGSATLSPISTAFELCIIILYPLKFNISNSHKTLNFITVCLSHFSSKKLNWIFELNLQVFFSNKHVCFKVVSIFFC